MTIEVTLHTPDNQDVLEGSYIDVIRTALQYFAGGAWEEGHAAALLALVTITGYSDEDRLRAAIKFGIETALKHFPEGVRDELWKKITRPHRTEAMRRYYGALGRRKSLTEIAKDALGPKK